MTATPTLPADATGYAALDWLARVSAPAWLDAAGLHAEAASLRGLAPLLDIDAARAGSERLRAMQTVAYHRSGVLLWRDVFRQPNPAAESGGLEAANRVRDIGGHLDPDANMAVVVAGYAYATACYAAHAATHPVAGRPTEVVALPEVNA